MNQFDWYQHKKSLTVGGCIVVLLLGWWLYSSYDQAIAMLERKNAAAITELAQLRASLKDYRTLEAKLKAAGVNHSDGKARNLIEMVENATQQAGARKQLLYVRPQANKVLDNLVEEGVEIKLEKLQLRQVVDLLYQFETRQPLKVSQLKVKTDFDDPDFLDVVIALNRFKEKR